MLAAQRFLYSRTKIYYFSRLTTALLIAIIGPILSSRIPSTAEYIALFSICYLVLDLLVFESLESLIRTKAAKIQELFDAIVLELDWNKIVVGTKPDLEDIHENSQKLKHKKSIEKLQNWYPSKIVKLPISIARIICQRSNVWWDAKMRKVFFYTLVFLLIIIVIILLVVGLSQQQTLKNVIQGIFLPVLPLILMLLNQIIAQKNTIKYLHYIKNHTEDLLDGNFEEKNDFELSRAARTIQDEIYRHRKSCLPIPNFLFFKLRDSFEKQMIFNAEEKIEQILNKEKPSIKRI